MKGNTMARTKAKGVHYVDNKKFHEAMVEYKEKQQEAEETGEVYRGEEFERDHADVEEK